ncbi:MAG: hypothetical protein ABW352_12155 [Polyangiales bacterium]
MKRWLALLAIAACTRASTIGYVEPVLDADVADAALQEDAAPEDAGVLVVDDCVPGISTAVPIANVEALRAARVGTGRWLYPYDETVMPRGVGAPALMWEGVEAEAVLVRVQARALSYEACWFPDEAQTAQLSDAAWTLIEQNSQGRDDPITVEVAMLRGSQAERLPARTLTIASERLGGSLFYMASSGPLTTGPTGVAVLQLPLGAASRPVLAPVSCGGCHAVSANGSRLLAFSNGLGALLALDASGAKQIGTPVAGELTALSPTGDVYVSPARGLSSGPPYRGSALTPAPTLHDTDTGAPLDAGLVSGVMMPAFASEGDALVFTDFSLANGKGLATMRYDASARRFDDYRTLFTSDRYPGWPSFLPGQRGVVFALGERNDYSGGGYSSPGKPPPSDLHAHSLATGSTVMLHRAMGFASANDADAERSELPFPEDELHKSYNPQVAPTQAGGFHWVFFDSVRHYGNRGLRRQIWCAAIDADDPSASHPAFYVRGQERDGTTFRPVWAR